MKNTWNYFSFLAFGFFVETVLLIIFNAPSILWSTAIISSLGFFVLYRFLIDYRYFSNPVYREMKSYFISNNPIYKLGFSVVTVTGLVLANIQLISAGVFWYHLFIAGFVITLTTSTAVNAVRVYLVNKNEREVKDKWTSLNN